MGSGSATKFILSAAVLVMVVCGAASAATYDVGAGYPYPRLSNLPALAAGDLVQVHSGTFYEVKRWTQSGTSTAPITIRGVGATRPIIDANNLAVDGSMPNPRGVFQIEAAYIVIENLEFRNARNGNNAAGIRVTAGGNNAVVRNCVITNCDMGMMSDSSDNLLVESCEVAYNGTSAFAGYCHNFYLSGTRCTIRYCYIHDALYGQNFKTRGHYTELLYNYIADSQDGEIGFVDSGLTTTANSHAVMIGNVIISKDRGAAWNSVKFIQFGQDSGNAHTGSLFAFNNTFIAGTTRIVFLDANASGSSIVARNNIFYGSGNIANGSISGSNNWAMTGAAVPSGLTSTTFGSTPGFVNISGRDFHLASGSACIDIGTASLSYADGSGTGATGTPAREYVHHLQSKARATTGNLDAGAFESASAVVAPSIMAQPVNRTVTAGQTATFSITASGTAPLAYQWQKNSVNISGATSASYTTPATTTADSGSQFRCIVSNSAGSATSNAATLTVNSAVVAPSITAQPANKTVTAGQTATFSVTASGTAPLSYQWQKNSVNISGATSASYTTPATTVLDSGSQFRCVVSNSAGSATSNAATLTVNSNAGSIGNGTGLAAEYFDNIDLTGTRVARVDSTVNFDWGGGSPDVTIQADTFSARWNGQVQAKFSEAVTFYTFSDDGVRLWVNNQLVIDNWTDHGPTENASAPITLSAGVKYAIKMEFYESGGGATAKLLWSSASDAKGVIPQTQLYPVALPVNGNGNGLAGQYFDNMDLTSPKLTRTDATVDFDWGSGSPDAAVGPDTFSVRWTGQVQARFSETYTFYTISDDGIRLWVNGQQIINNWTDHGATENSGTLAMVAGQKYDLQLEYYENGGGALARLLWSSASEPKAAVPQSQLYSSGVVNSAPVVSSAATASPNPASAGQAVTFSVAAGDPDGDALTYVWNFGDGSSASAASATHAYAAAGTYTAVVTVSDGRGGTVSSSVSVSVVASSTTIAVNSGGAAVGAFAADKNFSGGSTYTSTSPVNTTGVTNPAPQAVYQSERYGNFTYTVSGLNPNASYTVRLHFAEVWWSSPGQRVFNVAINGAQVLANFDILASAGGKNIAIARNFTVNATLSGQIVIAYTTVKDNAKSSGIEIVSNVSGRAVPVANVDAPAMMTGDGVITSIDLGTVKAGKAFKIKLDAPQGKKAKLRWAARDRKELAPGLAARGGLVGGKPRKPGTYVFDLEVKGKKTSATNTYTLTVEP